MPISANYSQLKSQKNIDKDDKEHATGLTVDGVDPSHGTAPKHVTSCYTHVAVHMCAIICNSTVTVAFSNAPASVGGLSCFKVFAGHGTDITHVANAAQDFGSGADDNNVGIIHSASYKRLFVTDVGANFEVSSNGIIQTFNNRC